MSAATVLAFVIGAIKLTKSAIGLTRSVICKILSLVNGSKTYVSVFLTIVSAIGLVFSKNYSEGLSQLLQALTILFGGAAAASMRDAIAKLEAGNSAKAG